MARTRSWSLSRRLAVTTFVTSGVAVALACVVFIAYDAVSLRNSLVRDVGTLAAVIGTNTADALRFADPEAAEMILGSLAAASEVRGAVVYDVRGRVFAAYRAGDAEPLEGAGPAPGRHVFGRHALELTAPLVLDGERLGSIRVSWDTSALTQRFSSYVLIVALLLAVVYGVSHAIARMLRGRVAEPLAEMAAGAQAIARGRLDTRVQAGRDDEIGDVARSFNTMAASLEELVAQVRDSGVAVTELSEALSTSALGMSADVRRQESAIEAASGSIAHVTDAIRETHTNLDQVGDRARETASSIFEMDASINQVASHMDELSGSIDGASSGAVQLAASVEEIAAAMDVLEGSSEETASLLRQLAAAVHQVEGNAKECGELSTEASREATRGTQAVEETVAAMQAIRASFERIESSVGGLAQKSDAIGEVLGVIQSIVERTNLLALNAAIIASQAGEQGRAFAVVAGEVRGLAEHTARSTQEIAVLIESVQSETAAAVDAVAGGSETVARGVSRSRVAGEVLGSILEHSEGTALRVREIVEATGRQAMDLGEVEVAMGRVRERVEQTHRNTREQTKLAVTIRKVVDRVRQLGHDVKLSTAEQSRQSEVITRAVHDVDTGVAAVVRRSEAQARESQTIHEALDVFREVAAESARRANAFEQMVSGLAQRSERLRRAMDQLKAE